MPEDGVELGDQWIEPRFIYRKPRELRDVTHIVMCDSHQP
jgi:hypothetical protein